MSDWSVSRPAIPDGVRVVVRTAQAAPLCRRFDCAARSWAACGNGVPVALGGGGPRREVSRGVRLRFDGWIAGLGTRSGVRLVVGHWVRSPFGPFSDVMIERQDGERLLLAPARQIADFVAATYAFEEVRVVPVRVRATAKGWVVTAPSLDLRLGVGARGVLGWLLRAVPGPLAARPGWSALVDLPARLMPGVRTRGRSGADRREWYGVRDLRPIVTARAVLEGAELGPLAPVEPPVRFGFGSVPRKPAVVRVTTTVGLDGGRPARAWAFGRPPRDR